MLTKQLIISTLLAFSLSSANIMAAGSAVVEDFTVDRDICHDMLDAASKKDATRFVELADAVLKLSEAQRRDSSMAIDRFRPKLRAAKKAAKAGDFEAAAKNVEEAVQLMHPASATWDGGS